MGWPVQQVNDLDGSAITRLTFDREEKERPHALEGA
jgi:hypothetical protein